MRAAAAGSLWVLVTVGLAGCAGGGSLFVEQPVWKSGYSWAFSTEESYTATEYEDGEADTWNETEHYRVVHEVMNTSMTQDGEPLYVVALLFQEEDDTRRHVQVVRQRDLSALPFTSRMTTSCVQEVCNYSFAIANINTSAPTFLDFPLERGKRWGGAFGDDLPFMYEAKVDGAYMVETPLGRTSAARITIVAEADVSQLRREILAEAAEEGFRVDELRFDLSHRQVVYYSHDYQTIIRAEVASEESFYARGRDPDGQPFEFEGEDSYRYRSVVEGARLVAHPERGMEQVAAFMAGSLQLRDPSGQAVGSVEYSLGIDPPSATVNVGAGQTQTFKAVVNGTMPETHSLSWRLVDGAGREVATGAGSEFSAAPVGPGVYGVELEAVDGDAVVAATGARLVGNWHKVETIACAPVVAAGACMETTIPMVPGVQRLQVRATPESPVPGVSDTLWVRDSAGQQITGTRSGDAYVVTLDPVAGHPVDGTPWEVEFRRLLGVASSVELEVEALYGAAPQAEPAPGTGVMAPRITIAW